MEIEKLYDAFRKCGGKVTTDSRAISGGEMFFAIKGENFDGNAFALKAIEQGAGVAVVNADSEAAASGNPAVIAVTDTLAALKELAAWHREHTFVDGKRLTVIGLTGTNGKTTTKEFIRAVLAKKYVVTATEGNLNNDIGVPLSVLKINGSTQIAVIEMGANHPEDIAALTPVSRPDFGLITNVGKAHLLGFGSFEGVKHAKGRLYDWLHEHGGTAFVNADDANLKEMAAQRDGMPVIPYGIAFSGAEVLPSSAEHPFLRMKIEGRLLETKVVGAYNANNAMAAIAVGAHFGVSLDDALAAIAAFEPKNNRSQMVRTDSNTLVVDAYNANPSSMAAALDNFALDCSPKKVVLLGDMRELGDDSVKEHVAVVEKIKSMSLDLVCLVGDEFRKALDQTGTAENVKWFATSAELAEALKAQPVKNATVLVKGSRGIKMETAIPEL